MLNVAGDSSVGKSAITQVFHSDGSHFPKAYVMVCTDLRGSQKAMVWPTQYTPRVSTIYYLTICYYTVSCLRIYFLSGMF